MDSLKNSFEIINQSFEKKNVNITTVLTEMNSRLNKDQIKALKNQKKICRVTFVILKW